MCTWTCPWGLSGDLSIEHAHLLYYSSLHSNLKFIQEKELVTLQITQRGRNHSSFCPLMLCLRTV